MTTSPPRRLRFGLRTLFALVTIVAVCLWIDNSLSWIRQRHEFLQAYPQDRFVLLATITTTEESLKAPGLLWFFGESAVQCLGVPSNDREAAEKATRLFPEAELLPHAILEIDTRHRVF